MLFRNGTIKEHCCDNQEVRNGICVGKYKEYLIDISVLLGYVNIFPCIDFM